MTFKTDAGDGSLLIVAFVYVVALVLLAAVATGAAVAVAGGTCHVAGVI